MRWVLFAVFAALLCSCGPSAVLYTDDLFEAAVPEVSRAWSSLPPFHAAELRRLPAGAGWAGLQTEILKQTPSTALVGMALSSDDRRSLVAALPGRRVVFFVADAPGPRMVVDRGQAWATVARSAARAHRPGFALFPRDAQDEKALFTKTWTESGGGPLTSWIWPEVGTIPHEKVDVFQWVGPEADGRMVNLGPLPLVHGAPGTVRYPGASGLTWRVQESGLGEFLWKVAAGNDEQAHFLPLETVPANR